MGFDNESILNIQSLPGEYFCPICRQLVYPNEALQTQCTHLYCKPCLTYCVSTTLACACCCRWINMAGLSSKTIPTPCKSYPCCSPPWLAAWFSIQQLLHKIKHARPELAKHIFLQEAKSYKK